MRVAGLVLGGLLVAAAGTLDALAEFALLRPVKDGTLIENPAGALSNGSGPGFFAGRTSSTSGSIRRAVLAFDVAAAVPRGSTVTRAVLRLNLSSTTPDPSRSTCTGSWPTGARGRRRHRVAAGRPRSEGIPPGSTGTMTTFSGHGPVAILTRPPAPSP
jgi:hypothetical protein